MRAEDAPSKPADAGSDPVAGLNPAQRAAVTHPGGPLLIVAGPGSGKTRVITERVAWLVRERGVDPRRILAITFTNKAAREMRERVERRIGAAGAWICTFHALGARILRREIETLGGWTRDFTIWDQGDRQAAVRQAIQQAGFDTARFRPAVVAGWISAHKNAGRERGAEGEQGELAFQSEVFRKVLAGYQEAQRRANALDFDDLLVKLLELFERHPGVRDAWAERFLHLLVDEYQDTNRVQYELVRHFESRHGNVTVCGDPDQAIYGWRGADLRNILDFERDHPGCKVVLLEQNYRSVNTVLKAAQAVIEQNQERKLKDLWSERGAGAPIERIEADSEEDEARAIAERIQELEREGVRARDIAVLYRVNFLQRALETALRLARVPYEIVAGLEFYNRREIKDLVAFAKLAVNPRDDLAFRRVVNVPARGIGERTLEELASFAADRRIPLAEAARSGEALARVRGRARAGLLGFGELVVRLQELAARPAGEALRGILELIDRGAWLAEMQTELDVDRDANVEELVAHADAWDADLERRRAAGEDARGGLGGFLEEIALVSDSDADESATDRVRLMTLHAAKGLEFPVVFVAGCEEELLPHVRAIQSVDEPRAEGGVEEERRLFYVGLTRAAERLILTHARSRRYFGAWSLRVPSRFLAEIPRELVSAEGESESEDDGDALGVFERPSDAPEFRVGDRVEHDHFGPGTVETLQGSGVNARAVVRFPAYGTKTLLLQYAKLRKAGSART